MDHIHGAEITALVAVYQREQQEQLQERKSSRLRRLSSSTSAQESSCFLVEISHHPAVARASMKDSCQENNNNNNNNKGKKQSKSNIQQLQYRSSSLLTGWMLGVAVVFCCLQAFTFELHLSSTVTAAAPNNQRRLSHSADDYRSPQGLLALSTHNAQVAVATLTQRHQAAPSSSGLLDNNNNHPAPNSKTLASLLLDPARSHPRQRRLVDVLKEARVYETLSNQELEMLPRLEQTFWDLYGPFSSLRQLASNSSSDSMRDSDGPVIFGMETCERYRALVPNVQERYVAPAGLFNSGTNHLEMTLRRNLQGGRADGAHYKGTAHFQVPWGKHRPEAQRLHHRAPKAGHLNQTKCLPIIIIRDPYQWMQSMCNSPYEAKWKHKKLERCPNLVASNRDKRKWGENIVWNEDQLNHQDEEEEEERFTTFQVKLEYDDDDIEYYDSLIDLWNDWYRPYFDNKQGYPRLMIRFEDMLMHAPAIVRTIAECMGISQKSLYFEYQTSTAKPHGSDTDFLSAIIKTTDIQKRRQGLMLKDKIYAAQHLDEELMRAFRYRVVEE